MDDPEEIRLSLEVHPFCGGFSFPRRGDPSFYKWPGAESNCRHADFQSAALPTELPGPIARGLSPAARNVILHGGRWNPSTFNPL